jgi:Icc-related predicted phosphoesterase
MSTSLPDGQVPGPAADPPRVRVAACADVHCRTDRPNPAVDAFAALDDQADLLLIAGDLTTYGVPEEAQVLADACRDLSLPIYVVLGNHDWHCNRADEVTAVLEEAGVHVLDRTWGIEEINGLDVGIVGAKGFIGGFAGSHLPDFGEPSLRGVYREASAEVEGIERGLCEVANCPLRIVLMHYAPTSETLVGEPEGIWTFLGTDRLAAPLIDHAPDLVVHGHAHAGTFAGKVGEVAVYNVSVPVIGRDYWLFELEAEAAARSAIH